MELGVFGTLVSVYRVVDRSQETCERLSFMPNIFDSLCNTLYALGGKGPISRAASIASVGKYS